MFDFKLTMAAIALAALAAAYAGGRIHGDYLAQLAFADERAKAETAYADALTALASAVTQADAEAEQRRAEARALARQVTRERDAKLARMPAADCVVDDARRVLAADTYCARFPAAPACVQRAMPGLPNSAADTQ